MTTAGEPPFASQPLSFHQQWLGVRLLPRWLGARSQASLPPDPDRYGQHLLPADL